MSSDVLKSNNLKAEALSVGFSHCGVVPAEPVDEAYMAHYEQWLRNGWQGDMHYMEDHLALRRDPRLLLPGARSVVSLLMSYNPGLEPTQKGIAWYAQGRDYHDVIRQRLRTLVGQTVAPVFTEGEVKGAFRICVDTAPVMEKYWAWRCGLGWIGRHTQFVVPGEGSAFFLAELLLTFEFDHYDAPRYPVPYHLGCGTCRRCLDACPTHAITDSGLDARHCLSYLTIEHRGSLPDDVRPLIRECFYGCDRCLRACPHYRAIPTAVPEFRPTAELLSMSDADWAGLSLERYRQLFRGSAVKRAKYEGLLRNLGRTAEPDDDQR